MVSDVKHIKPDDLEFADIAKTITHVTRVRKDHFGKRVYIDADVSAKSFAQMRREDVHKSRG